MMKNTLFKKILLVTCYLLLVTIFCGFRLKFWKKPFYKATGVMMGSYVEIVSDRLKAHEIFFNEIERLEKLFSKYDPQSEVSQLNTLGKLKVSPETIDIIEQSLEFHNITNELFDISVGPLIDLWGFTDKKCRLPSEEEIKNTLVLVGEDKIIIDKKNSIVEFGLVGMKIDLGGVAPGYAIDSSVKKLRAAGINNFMINAGGEIYCSGIKNSRHWHVAIKHPRNPDNILMQLELENQAVATSGDYEQYFSIEGKRYSHIIDPRTGAPANTDVVSVTVIAPDCITADILSTSLVLLGKEKAIKLVDRLRGVEAIIITQDEEGQLDIYDTRKDAISTDKKIKIKALEKSGDKS